MQYTLAREGSWYKGNLHTHTTLSDGKLTPEEVFSRYRNNGYSFLAITDHRLYGTFEEVNSGEFLVLPGVELDTIYEGKPHHIVGISTPSRAKLRHGSRFGLDSCGTVSPQRMIDALRETGNIAIYAHPFWSYIEPHELCGLSGLTGIEIFNYSCDQRWRTGNAEQHFELMLAKGLRPLCFASDDTHYHTPDVCGGYITAKCVDFSHDAILKAIEAGSFYASSARPGEEAPQILDFVVEDGVAKVWTSPCEGLYLLGGWARFRSQHGEKGKPVSYLEYRFPEDVRQVHAVAVDTGGRISWSQPIWLDRD